MDFYPAAEAILTNDKWDGWGTAPLPGTPRYIIIHGTGSSLTDTAQDIGHYFQTSPRDTSTHFVVGRDGHVVQCVSLANRAWGNGVVETGHDAFWDTWKNADGTPTNPNNLTISIEHVNDAANSTALTPQQQAASFALVLWLCRAFDIPLRPADALGGITGHASISPVSRARCPGNYPWDALWATLQQESAGSVSTLPNFPHKDQRSEQTIDGKPPENGSYDCVATSFAAAIQYLTGRFCSGDELKDAEYGDSYIGGTALVKYVDQSSDRARAVYGVTATAYNDPTTTGLIHQIRAWVNAGFPVIATIPSAWGTSHDQATLNNPNFSTHAICFYSADASSLTAMNPWGGFDQSEPDSWWAGRLCYGQVWQIHTEGNGEPAMPVLTVDQTQGYFHTISTDDSAWRCNTTGQPVQGAILRFYRSCGGAGQTLQGLTALGLPVSGELAPDASYNGRYQVFERGVICFDPSAKWDKPAGVDLSASGSNGCYFPHLDNSVVQGQLNKSLTDQLAKATSDALAAESQRDSALAQLKQAQAALASAQAAQAKAVAEAQASDAARDAALAAQKAAEDARDAAVAAESSAEAKDATDGAEVQALTAQVAQLQAQVAELEAGQGAAAQALQALQMAAAAIAAASSQASK